ncbi:MAG: hypothetical protein AAGA91_16060 [Pseudomonadota bacterium]
MRVVLISFVAMLIVPLAMAEQGGPDGPGVLERQQWADELGLTPEQLQQMREIRESGGSREDVRAVLTEEQRAKADALRGESKGQRDKRWARLQKQLGLSDEQISEMEAIREAGGTPDEVRSVLTDEQRAKAETMRKPHRPMSY